MINQYKMAKHFELTITDDSFTLPPQAREIAREAQLDGLYVVRTSVPADTLSADEAVRAYKDLARVERAFRIAEIDRPADPPGPSLGRAAGSRPRLPVHAGLLRRVAPARGVGPDLIP